LCYNAPMQNQGNSKLVASIIAVLVVAGAIFGFASYNSKQVKDETTPVVPTPEPVSTSTPVDTAKKSKYNDGTYSATGSYGSPGGPDKIKITLTLKDDIVTSASAVSMAGDPMSKNFQAKFISGFQAVVVGKNIDDLNVSVVSGSSLTSKGFNDAVAQIKLQAKA